jgi:hypothetical protein
MKWHAKFISGAHLWEWRGSWGGFWEEMTTSGTNGVGNSEKG